MTNMATITVSGYDPIPAAYVILGGRIVGTYAGSCDLAVIHGMTWHHCPKCNKALRPTHDRNTTLGFPLCPPCDAAWTQRCLATHHRLPTRAEFYCSGCAMIWDRVSHLCPPDRPDGRQRWRCKACRRQQWTRANWNRAERARA